MEIWSECRNLSARQARSMLKGLPRARGYEVVVTPLRYRSRPHLVARIEYDSKRIVLQVPEPFVPFGEVVDYAARRRGGSRMRFIWLSEGRTFRTRREVLRFLYCHEWFHWFLKERLGRTHAGETACERFALRNYRRERVTVADAQAALRR